METSAHVAHHVGGEPTHGLGNRNLVERRELLIEVREMNGFVRTISSGLERVSVRSVLLKFASAKTVIGFQEAAERYDDFLESLELSLNEDLLAMVMADPTPHLRETENAV